MLKLLDWFMNLIWEWEIPSHSQADDYQCFGYEEIAKEFEVDEDQ